jgi:hypothetical protein
MDWLLRFLPEEKRQMVVLAQRIVGRLDTPDERRVAIAFGSAMLADGKVTVGEWAKFGSVLGILKGPQGPNSSAQRVAVRANER